MTARAPEFWEVSSVVHYKGKFWRVFRDKRRNTHSLEISIYENAMDDYFANIGLQSKRGEFFVDNVLVAEFKKAIVTTGKRYNDVIHYFIESEDE